MRHSRVMVDIGCTFNESAIEVILTKKSISNRNDERCTSQDPFVYGRLESGVGFGVRDLHRRPVDSSKRVLSWVQREYFCKNVSEREMISNTMLWCGS